MVSEPSPFTYTHVPIGQTVPLQVQKREAVAFKIIAFFSLLYSKPFDLTKITILSQSVMQNSGIWEFHRKQKNPGILKLNESIPM